MQTLENHLLIAMPNLDDPHFKRSVTYICEHNANGAMGIVINHPLSVTVADLLSQLNIAFDQNSPAAKAQVCAGGPVQSERGFVLHTRKTGYASSLALPNGLMVTTSKDILENLTSEEAPEQFILALGYAGWDAGQLEEELAQNSWLTIPADPHIIFELSHAQKWQGAAQSLGVDVWQISPQIGHA